MPPPPPAALDSASALDAAPRTDGLPTLKGGEEAIVLGEKAASAWCRRRETISKDQLQHNSLDTSQFRPQQSACVAVPHPTDTRNTHKLLGWSSTDCRCRPRAAASLPVQQGFKYSHKLLSKENIHTG